MENRGKQIEQIEKRKFVIFVVLSKFVRLGSRIQYLKILYRKTGRNTLCSIKNL